jgi:hypothetical protein
MLLVDFMLVASGGVLISNKKGQPKTRNDKKKFYIHGQEHVYHTR